MNTLAAPRSACATDAGRQRVRNEDRIWADDARGLYMVADGLGGHAAGDVAAETAVEVVVRELRTASWSDPQTDLARAITTANNEIYSLAQRHPDNAGMACVLTLLCIRDDVATVAHVGDSRLYLFWNGTLRKLTSDHSPVGEQEDQGELSESEAMSHPRRNEVFRDVGSREREAQEPDFIELRSFPFHPSAALLLCTDGLSDALTAGEIAGIIETYDGDADTVVRSLVDAANENGGLDNVSVIFVPGPEFVGARSIARAEARARHAITRIQRRRAQWKRRLGKLALLIVGILLGMAILAIVQRVLPSGGPLK
jgi:serine/threonine protein phosphatase PrpC